MNVIDLECIKRLIQGSISATQDPESMNQSTLDPSLLRLGETRSDSNHTHAHTEKVRVQMGDQRKLSLLL